MTDHASTCFVKLSTSTACSHFLVWRLAWSASAATLALCALLRDWGSLGLLLELFLR